MKKFLCGLLGVGALIAVFAFFAGDQDVQGQQIQTVDEAFHFVSSALCAPAVR